MMSTNSSKLVEIERVDISDDDELEDCMEFQIGLTIEPENQKISIVTQNGNNDRSNYSVAATNINLKRKLDFAKAKSSRSSTSSYQSTATSVRPLNKSKAFSPNEALDTATILSAIDNLRELMTQIATRTEQLYEDFQLIKTKTNLLQDNFIIDRTHIGIPFETKEELIDFEEKIKNDKLPRELFKKCLLKCDDRTWEKYISNCLFSCFKQQLAVCCSFYGKNNNMEIQHLEVTNVLRECVEEKFSTIRTADMNQAIMKWFHLATDRYKRIKDKL